LVHWEYTKGIRGGEERRRKRKRKTPRKHPYRKPEPKRQAQPNKTNPTTQKKNS
jgi:hypothetical protein